MGRTYRGRELRNTFAQGDVTTRTASCGSSRAGPQPERSHPQRAKELLTTIVGEDHGNNVFGWQRGLRDQLKLQGVIQDDPPTANATPGTAQQ